MAGSVDRTLEKERAVFLQSLFALALCVSQQSGKIDHQGRSKNCVATLPCKLHRHSVTQKSFEVNQVPCCFVVTEAGNVIDPDLTMDVFSEEFMNQLTFGGNFTTIFL